MPNRGGQNQFDVKNHGGCVQSAPNTLLKQIQLREKKKQEKARKRPKKEGKKGKERKMDGWIDRWIDRFKKR
jgi:hypothetical protein